MKVLHLNDHYQCVGGAEVILFNWLAALEERGIINVVVYQHPTNIRNNHRRTHQVPALGEIDSKHGAAVANRFLEILREEQPDLIHIHDVGNPRIAEISLRFGPTVQSVFNHSFYCPGGMKYLPLRGKICEYPFGTGCLISAFSTRCNSIRPRVLLTSYHRSYRMLRKNQRLIFLAISKYQAQCLVQNWCPPALVKVLSPFTALPALNTQENDSLRQNMLLFTGRIFPYKGLDLLLRSLKHIKLPIRLVVDGDGPDLGRARKLVRELGLEDRVDFVGWAPRDKHLAYYRQASVVVVPSVWPEPFGMVGIEAMSYAKPVVAFNVGGIPEWLEDGFTGFLIKPYGVREMAEKINYLLENPDIAQEMGMRGRKKVEADFNKDTHMNGLLRIYREALDGWDRS